MKKVPRIAIVGWYHKLNYGDDLLQRALTGLFADCSLSFIGIEAVEIGILNGFDHVIYGGGSIYPNRDLTSAAFLDRLKVPISLLGISARGVENPRVLRQLLARCTVCVVRDEATAAEFGDSRKILVAPDLVWLTPHPVAAAGRRDVGVNLRRWPKLAWDAAALQRAMRRALPRRRLRGLSFYEGASVWESGKAMRDRDFMAPLGFDEMASSLHENSYAEFDLVVAMRFHALVLALQAGVPCIGFDYHPKTQSLFAELQMADYCVRLDDPAALEQGLLRLQDDHAALRGRLLQNRERMIEKAASVYGEARGRILEARGSVAQRAHVLRWLPPLRWLN